MNSNFGDIHCSCHANINNLQESDRNFNTNWQFGMFKRGKDNGHDTWKM